MESVHIKTMRRSYFKNKQRKPLKRSSFKRKKKEKKIKRTKLPTLKKLQKRCDDLMTPIAKKLHPKCELKGDSCTGNTEVGHHYYKKSQSNSLRYYINNIVGLCNRCHCALHARETPNSNKIRDRRGEEWYADVKRVLNSYCKVDRFYYEEQFKKLTKILSE